MSELLNFFGHNPGLLAQKALEHLWISAIAMAISMAIALPIGVYLGHVHRGSFLAISFSNVLRALPSLALIAVTFPLFGLSPINVQLALVALALPPLLTNTYTAVDQVDSATVDAARGVGLTEAQILRQVELPLSWTLIFAGIRTATVYVVATATLAGLVGGGGLGDIIVDQATYGLAGVVAATLVVVALAFAADALQAVAQRAVTPAGVRPRGRATAIVPLPTPEVAGMEALRTPSATP